MRKFLRLVPLLAALAASPAAGASRPAGRVLVLPLAGDDGRLRGRVVRVLRARGFAAADGDRTADPPAAVIDGGVRNKGGRSILTLRARRGPAGPLIASATFSGGRHQIQRAVARQLERRLGRALARALADAHMEPLGPALPGARPPPTTAVDEDEPLALRAALSGAEDDDGDGDGDDDGGDEPAARPGTGVLIDLRQAAEAAAAAAQSLDLSFGVHIFTRHFFYRDPNGPLTPYRLLWAPAPTANLDWFPFDFVGLTAGGEIEAGATTTDRDGINYPTAHYGVAGGLKLRAPVRSVWLTLTAEVGLDVFRIDDASPDAPKPPVPSVRYQYARVGLAVLLRPTSYLTLALSGGYRQVLGAGEIEDSLYFPHAAVHGFDGAATLGVRLRRGLELRVTADLRRYTLELHSQSTDLRMAGSAFDDYFGGTVSLAVLIGGRHGI
ncbi:MAG TPA: hypothetical protein VMU50_19465 [Polyangia bacterium]|nr:hypothetical protein [Polyangia bacterium]